MKRYLIYFAYVGEKYSGLQIQNQPGVRTVTGAILHAATRALKLEDVSFKSSSRTDKGVHALCNTATLDVWERPNKPVTGRTITSALNEQFYDDKEDIRILHTRRVPLTFSPRKCLSRSYLYRFCFAKYPEQLWTMPFPPQENLQVWLNRDTLDINAMKTGAELLSGTHDFSCFTTAQFEKERSWRNPVKELEVKINEGKGHLEDHMPHYADNFSSWNVVFTSGSFLYRQVRLMMSTLVDVGQGKTNLDELNEMIENPEKYKTDHPNLGSKRTPAPAYALYLKNVVYDQTEMELTDEEKENEELELPRWLLSDNRKNMNFLDKLN